MSKAPEMAFHSSLQCPAYAFQEMMQDGRLNSESLVDAFLNQICRHNHDGMRLRAITSVCPRNIALARARKLDDERRHGQIRSNLHGIPVVIKVS